MIVIEKNIAIPHIRTKPKSELRKLIEKMEKGDSVFVSHAVLSSISFMISLIKKDTKKEFTTRTIDGGIRIWRIK